MSDNKNKFQEALQVTKQDIGILIDRLYKQLEEAKVLSNNLQCCANCIHADIEREFDHHSKMYCNNDVYVEWIYPNDVCGNWKWNEKWYEERAIQWRMQV